MEPPYPTEHTACYFWLQKLEQSFPILEADTKDASQTIRIYAFTLRIIGAVGLAVASVIDLSIWSLKTVTIVMVCYRGLANHFMDLVKTILCAAYVILLPRYLVRRPLHNTIIDLTNIEGILSGMHLKKYRLRCANAFNKIMELSKDKRNTCLKKVNAHYANQLFFTCRLIQVRWYSFALQIINHPEDFSMTPQELGTVDRIWSHNTLFKVLFQEIRDSRRFPLEEEGRSKLNCILTTVINNDAVACGLKEYLHWPSLSSYIHTPSPDLDLLSLLIDRTKRLDRTINLKTYQLALQDSIRDRNANSSDRMPAIIKLIEYALAAYPDRYWEIFDKALLTAIRDKDFIIAKCFLQYAPRNQQNEEIPLSPSLNSASLQTQQDQTRYKQATLSHALYILLHYLPESWFSNADEGEMALLMLLLEQGASTVWRGNGLRGLERLLLFSSPDPAYSQFWISAGNYTHIWTPAKVGARSFDDFCWCPCAIEGPTYPKYFQHWIRTARNLLLCSTLVPLQKHSAFGTIVSLQELEKAYTVMRDCCKILLDKLQPNLQRPNQDIDRSHLRQFRDDIHSEIDNAYRKVVVESMTEKDQRDYSDFQQALKNIFSNWPQSILQEQLSRQEDQVRGIAIERTQLCLTYCQDWIAKLPMLNEILQETRKISANQLANQCNLLSQDVSNVNNFVKHPLQEAVISDLIAQFLIGVPLVLELPAAAAPAVTVSEATPSLVAPPVWVVPAGASSLD